MTPERGAEQRAFETFERVVLAGALLAGVMTVVSFVHPAGRTEIPVEAASDLVAPAQDWASDFEATHRAVRVDVGCAGPEGALAALLNGTAALAVTPRRMRPDEEARFVRRFGGPAHELRVEVEPGAGPAPRVAWLYSAAPPEGALERFLQHVASSSRGALSLADTMP